MKRIDVIREIMGTITDELIISSAGMISREVYAVKDRSRNFYVMGSMGATLGVGIGLALNTDMNILVLAGDGEALMSLGSLVLMNRLSLPNLRLVILDNNSYQSTGGQRTRSDAVDFTKICNCEVFKVELADSNAPRIDIPHTEVSRRFRNEVIGSQ